MKKSRKREHRVRIRAPIEAVWRALVEPDEIPCWYALEASVEPGEGGRMRLSWGESFAAHSRIVVWKPESHLRLVHELDAPVTEDFLLEREGEVTLLRLVQSEIPDDADWDDFYEETNRGWKMFLAGLRHYLERHLGQTCVNIAFMQPIHMPVELAWRKLLGPSGLAVAKGDGALATGQRHRVSTLLDQVLDTEVIVCEPPYTLSLAITNLDDAILALDFEGSGPRTVLFSNLSTFEMEPARVEALRTRFREWIERLFPAPAGVAT